MLDFFRRASQQTSLSETSDRLGLSLCAVHYQCSDYQRGDLQRGDLQRGDLALRDVNLEVGPTEMVAIIADDDQRAMLIDLLAGRAVPSAGSITIAGREIQQMPTEQDQFDRLGPNATTVAGNDLIIFDEPTAEVETVEERQLIATIEAACDGRCAVVFTHRLALARKADRVLVLEDGRLVPYRGHGPRNHNDLWETRVPPVIEPELSLRLVSSEETRPQAPRRMPGLSVGDLVSDRYQLCALVGRNVSTETWSAQDMTTEQTVRIKVPRHPFTSDARDQIRREHDVVMTLRHPGTAQVLDAELDDEMPYVVFEHVNGLSLADVLDQRSDGLDLVDVLNLGFEIAEILHHLHRQNLVHLNLRTGHVRFRGSSVVLTDFSQCRPKAGLLPPAQRPAPSVRPVQGPGSLRPLRHYAPELRPGGIADPKIDIYAIGVLLRKAACGPDAVALLPFANTRPDAPKELAALIDAMTAIEPEERPDGAEVMAGFRPYFPMPPTVNLDSTPPPRSPRLRLVSAHPG